MKSLLLKLRIAVFAISLIVFGVTCAVHADTEPGFQPAGGPVEVRGNAGIYEWRYKDTIGPSFYDKILLHRITRGPRPAEHSITVLYLPGTNMNGDIALFEPRYSL